MLRRSIAILALLALGAAAALATSGCGPGSVPADAVARVGDSIISKQEFDQRLTVRAKGQQAQLPKKMRQKNPVPKAGTPEYKALSDAVMQSLITERINSEEAGQRGIEVKPDQVQKRFETEKKQFFPKEKDYQKFLKQTGQTQPEILERVKAAMLAEEVNKAIVKGTEKVSDHEIKDNYEKNKKKQFTRPQTRELLVVLNKSQKKIDAAKKALEKGEDFKKVAKKYSEDPSSKQRGGKATLPRGLAPDKALDSAVFGAKVGALGGPVKIQSGSFLLFKVTKDTPPQTQPLDKVKEQIKQTLVSQNQQAARSNFEKKWKKKTKCAKGYQIALCSNPPPPAPPPKPTTAPTPPPPPAKPSKK